ncbi:MAG: hypothetical protein KDC38_21945, partial [Planctomycetes bacterium]|nr:hypothetical protein [Planctomycetota bacterium]
LVSADTKRTFGMRYSKGIVYALANGRPVVECDDPAWTKKIEPGQVAIVWNGQWVKGIIEKVRIKGRLDPKWLKEETTKL